MQLTIGDGPFIVGTARDDRFGMRAPTQLGGAHTQSFDASAADPDAHHARGYTTVDCEGR